MDHLLLIVLGLCFYVILCCCVLLYKNGLVYKIRNKWVGEVYDSQVSDKELNWDMIPSYNETLYSLTLWVYVPLKDYLNKDK